MSSKLAILPLVGLLGVACTEQPRPGPLEGFVTIWNRNSVSPEQPDFYEILEIYVHDFSDSRGQCLQTEASSVCQTLAIDAKIAVPLTSGDFVTVVRRRNTGQNIALTTGIGLEITSNCHVLEVFDETFRFTENGDVAVPALQAIGESGDCTISQGDDGPPDGGDPGGDPAPGD